MKYYCYFTISFVFFLDCMIQERLELGQSRRAQSISAVSCVFLNRGSRVCIMLLSTLSSKLLFG